MVAKRQIFYSFHYDNDVFRVQQIRHIGALEENAPVSVNDWEKVKQAGDREIESWIEDSMRYRSCVVVLVGEKTYARPWVRYEIKKAWADGKGLLGIYIHNLKCAKTIKNNSLHNGKSAVGKNPFDTFTIGDKCMSSIVHCYNPDSNHPYKSIRDNLESWVETAIQIRKNYGKGVC